MRHFDFSTIFKFYFKTYAIDMVKNGWKFQQSLKMVEQKGLAKTKIMAVLEQTLSCYISAQNFDRSANRFHEDLKRQ